MLHNTVSVAADTSQLLLTIHLADRGRRTTCREGSQRARLGAVGIWSDTFDTGNRPCSPSFAPVSVQQVYRAAPRHLALGCS